MKTIVRYLRIINHSEIGVICINLAIQEAPHCMIPYCYCFHIRFSHSGPQGPKNKELEIFFNGDAAIGCITHIPDAPWCWHIYLQNSVIFGVTVGKYSVHGAFGYLCIHGILQSNGSSDLQSLAFCLSRSFGARVNLPAQWMVWSISICHLKMVFPIKITI